MIKFFQFRRFKIWRRFLRFFSTNASCVIVVFYKNVVFFIRRFFFLPISSQCVCVSFIKIIYKLHTICFRMLCIIFEKKQRVRATDGNYFYQHVKVIIKKGFKKKELKISFYLSACINVNIIWPPFQITSRDL